MYTVHVAAQNIVSKQQRKMTAQEQVRQAFIEEPFFSLLSFKLCVNLLYLATAHYTWPQTYQYTLHNNNHSIPLHNNKHSYVARQI